MTKTTKSQNLQIRLISRLVFLFLIIFEMIPQKNALTFYSVNLLVTIILSALILFSKKDRDFISLSKSRIILFLSNGISLSVVLATYNYHSFRLAYSPFIFTLISIFPPIIIYIYINIISGKKLSPLQG